MQTRTKQPSNNKYYIRTVSGGWNGAVAGYPTIKGANVLCNCVGYANGRFNEIGAYGRCKYQLVCNAEDFIESAKRQGLKISRTPIQGGIMVWAKGRAGVNADGAGHVAVVEEVYEDGSILTSESGWNAWAFKTVRRNNVNGRWGQNEYYTFRGCIINPAVKDAKVVPAPKLIVDGIGGADTIRATQQYFNTPQDGVLSGQNKAQKKHYPSIIAVEYGTGGSACVKKLQKWVGVARDGVLGEETIKAWQKKIGATVDGVFGAESMKIWQKFLNKKLFNDKSDTTTKPSTSTDTKPTQTTTQGVYKVIDVSDWQSKIDWSKVKKDGVVGAIIRYADGTTLDKRFAENMKNAKAAGIHIGSYIFSRAKTKAEAEKEAERLYNACKPYAPDMPLYIDLEVSSLAKYADTVAQAFLKKMKALGGRGGVYANLNWWNNYLTDTAKNYSEYAFWIAQYNDKMTHKKPKLFGMWQYTSSGRVSGISGKVDMDHCYRAYWKDAPIAEPTKPEPTKPTVPKKTVDELALEVLNGKWGSGDDRKKRLTEAGYDYDAVQKRVNEILEEREKRIQKGNKWAERVASDKYHYVKWSEKDTQTHFCPICTGVDPVKDLAHFGFNCIGAAFAVWHHGIGLPCRCNNFVISNAVAEEIYHAKTNAQALAIAQKHIGLTDIEVIRNGSKNVPKSKWKAGDIALNFSGNTYNHTYYILGNGRIFESTGANGKVPTADQVRINKWDGYTARVIIRWKGYKVVK